jgi:DNA polymerase-3 subunit epsilon
MATLAAAHRFEEAAAMRDRADALARALVRQRRLDALRSAGRITIEVPGEGGAVLDRGRLVMAWPDGDGPGLLAAGDSTAGASEPDGPLPRDQADEVACVAAWLDARAGRLRLLDGGAGLAWPIPALPRLQPSRAGRAERRRAG